MGVSDKRTCLSCGFIGIGGNELTKAERIMISTPGSAAQPDWREIWCQRNCWVEYELIYAGPSYQGLQDELAKDRTSCEEFFPHRPGYSPDEHRALQEKEKERRERWILAALSRLPKWLTSLLGLT